MKLLVELSAWQWGPGYAPRAHYGSGATVQAKALAYYADERAEFHLPEQWDTWRRSKGRVGILTVITGHNKPSSAIGIEVRPHEMAEFCRAYLQEYEATKDENGWEDLPNIPQY